MGLTKAERDTLAALTEKAKAAEDEEKTYETWVKIGDHEVKLTGAKAKAYLRKHGLEDDDEEQAPQGGEDELPEDEEPAASKGYWKGKK